jgi:alpha-beta hydrolase superfamily lysophospholipase
MKHIEFERKTKDGLNLFFQGWQPEGEAKAVICLLHGFQEYSGRYQHLASKLAEENIALLAFDVRGHGKSQGQRGHAPSYEALMDDISILLDEARLRFPGKPLFLYGHSFGGNLALNYVLQRKPNFAGVIASAPWLRLAYSPSPIKVGIGRILNKLLPAFSLPTGLETKALSKDPAVVRAYEKDPLIQNHITSRMYFAILEAGEWALEHAQEFTLPLLIMHGGADRIISAAASQQFADGVPGKCTYKLWPGLYHEIHNEPEKEEVIAFLIFWIKKLFG